METVKLNISLAICLPRNQSLKGDWYLQYENNCIRLTELKQLRVFNVIWVWGSLEFLNLEAFANGRASLALNGEGKITSEWPR